MAGMFYSMKEASERLGKTEQEVKALAREGRLREFRDGANVMFKIDEVESLVQSAGVEGPQLSPEEVPVDLSESEHRTTEVSAAETEELLRPIDPELDVEAAEPFKLQDVEASTTQSDDDLEALLGLNEMEPVPSEETPQEEPVSAPAEDELLLVDDLGVAAPGPKDNAGDEAYVDLSDTQVVAKSGPVDDDILLASDTQASKGIEPTNLDTALTGEGMSVLSEGDGDFKLSDDTLAETSAGLGGDGASLEKIEEDVNLDSFGSGSGLLDLSLQADDTSLGGILDEIYTPEGDGGPEQPLTEAASAADVVAEADHLPMTEEAGALAMTEAPMMGQVMAEPRADTSSNMMGTLLFLPLAILIYTTIAAIGGLRGMMPGIVGIAAGMIWIIMAVLMVLTVTVSGLALVKSAGPRTPKPQAKPKEKKAKKQK